MFLALDPGDLGREVAMMLEKVQMPPGEFLEVMGLAQLPAPGTGEPGSSISADANMQFIRRLISIKPLINNFPGLF
jgi:hypothetical protein